MFGQSPVFVGRPASKRSVSSEPTGSAPPEQLSSPQISVGPGAGVGEGDGDGVTGAGVCGSSAP